jgi:hypothetical protein
MPLTPSIASDVHNAAICQYSNFCLDPTTPLVVEMTDSWKQVHARCCMLLAALLIHGQGRTAPAANGK